jgi:malonyl CoA-acyl carrier protein transacylase
MGDTLDVQIASYAANCTLCDFFQSKGIVAQVAVGYSMGIYAALYAGGYYSYETGLKILEKAFLLTQEICDSHAEEYAMAVLWGLTEKEIHEIVFTSRDTFGGISVYNGKHHFVIAGEKDVIENGIRRALAEGAFGAKRVFTRHPYHSKILSGISNGFLCYLNSLCYTPPTGKTLSPINGDIITLENIQQTINSAMFTPLRFDMTVHRMVTDFGISCCYEAGPIQSMKKLVRYIDKNIKVISPGKDIML